MSKKKKTTTKALNKAAENNKKVSEERAFDWSDCDHQYRSAYDFVSDTPRPRITPYTAFSK